MKKNSYYAVIAAKKRRGRRYAMVVPYEELERLMGSRVPVYFQKPCKSERAAEEQLDTFLFRKGGGKIRRISFGLFMLLSDEEKEPEQAPFQEQRQLPSSGRERACFYDSEFGMYNYGDQQGDVVLMGAVILRPQEEPQSFRSLICNREKAQMGERFQAFTGLLPEDIAKAPAFPEVWEQFSDYILRNRITVIYCLGNNDMERLSYMLEKYAIPDGAGILQRFRNFQKWLTRYDRRLSGFSLESLASLCSVVNQHQHDALADAETLGRVWEALMQTRPSDRQIAAEQEATKVRNRYRKSRRVSFEHIPVPGEIISQKNALTSLLLERNKKGKFISSNLLQALCAVLVDRRMPEEQQSL